MSRRARVFAAVGPAEAVVLGSASFARTLRDATGGELELDLAIADAPRAALLAHATMPPASLVAAGVVPADFAGYDAVLREVADAIVILSVVPDVAMPAWRHRASGWILAGLPAWTRAWGDAQRAAIDAECEALPPDPVDRVGADLAAIVRDVTARGAAATVLVNAFAFAARDVPGRPQLQERLAQLALVTAAVSSTTGAYVVDVDRVLGYHGARALATDWRADGDRARALIADELAAVVLEAATGLLGDTFDATAAIVRYRALGAKR